MNKLICKIIPWQEDIGSWSIKELLYFLCSKKHFLEIRVDEKLYSEIFVWKNSEFIEKGENNG